MSRRSRAREVALQVLFQDDLNPGGNPAEGDAFLLRRLRGGDPEVMPPFASTPPKATAARTLEASTPSRTNPFGERAPAENVGIPLTSAQSAVVEFARSLVAGVRRNRAELDELLGKTADNWRIERMAATDRNVMRLGAFELLYTETPSAVVINEAVELAKRYGSAQSAQFVNGILDKVKPANRK
jgi:N utilization substance protein B